MYIIYVYILTVEYAKKLFWTYAFDRNQKSIQVVYQKLKNTPFPTWKEFKQIIYIVQDRTW